VTVDVSAFLPADGVGAMRLAVNPVMARMKGSSILRIAADVNRLKADGRQICNLTVGDFSPAHFRIPDRLTARIQHELDQGQTNYPPADGVPELKGAILRLYDRELGLRYPEGSVCVGSGARPPIYAAWRLFTEPGDKTISFLPMWNVGYYADFCETQHVFIHTAAETNFFPTVEQVKAELPGARMMLTNSPLNPTGTIAAREVIEGIARALVAENTAREARGERPCIWVYDQVYWLLTAHDRTHFSPVQLVPEVAPWVVHVDAVSKWLAGTGVRVGWAVLPPHLQAKMKGLIGHMGAWAPKAEQLATAWFLDQPELMHAYLGDLRGAIDARLQKLYDAVVSMKQEGLPIDAIEPQGAIYMSLKVDLIGKGMQSNEEIRQWLLDEAGVAVVPFQAFDLMEDSGWFRMSVGAVGLAELDEALARLRAALRARLR